jgi:hypothetical protein
MDCGDTLRVFEFALETVIFKSLRAHGNDCIVVLRLQRRKQLILSCQRHRQNQCYHVTSERTRRRVRNTSVDVTSLRAKAFVNIFYWSVLPSVNGEA